MSGRRRDLAPTLRAAGRVFETPTGGIAAELCYATRAATPAAIARFRKSAITQPGRKGLHWGIAADPPPPDMRFGVKGEYSCSAQECLRANTASGFATIITDAQESKYASHRHEPLGKSSCEFLNPLPKHVQKQQHFTFGVTSDKSASAKDVMYTCGDQEEIANPAAEAKARCREAGHQRTRNYDWGQRDPAKIRFGRTTTSDIIKTKDLFEDHSTTLHLIPHKLAAHNAVATIQLGRPKNLGFGQRNLSPDHVFGRPGKLDEFNVNALMSGCGQPPQEDDSNLGKPVTHSATLRKLRSASLPPVDKTFGVPTIRTDIPKPKHQKVTNNNNYGDDTTAAALLYPSTIASQGLNEDDLEVSRPLEAVKRLVQRAGWGLTDDQVERAFASAASGGETTTLALFNRAVEALGF